MKRKIWILLLLVALGAGGYYGYQYWLQQQAAAATTLRTGLVSLGTVESAISGVGTVRAKQSATISWQTSGKVASVKAEIGQLVQAGDTLAALEPSSLSTSIIEAQADLISTQNDLEDLQEPDPLKIAEARAVLTTAQNNLDDLLNPSPGVILQAEHAVVDAQSVVDDAQTDVDRLKYGRGSQEDVELARAKYLLAQDKVERYQTTYEDTPGSPKEDPDKAMALSNLANAETARDQALAALNWYLGTPSEEEVTEANLTLALAQANLAKAEDVLSSLKAPTEEDIALAQAIMDDAQDALDSARRGATEEELILAQTRVTVAQATLDQAYLKAPFAGTITDLDVLTGDLVSQGTQAFQIHDLSMLFVELSISEVDISQVKLGQEAVLTFDAIADKEYSGKVTKISMTATSSQGVVNYPVTVQITNNDANILPGMTAAVNIVVEKHENVMVVPSTALRTINGQRTLIILFEGNQVSVPVTVGLTSDSMTEVSSSQLREGDSVVINGSTATSNTTTQQAQGSGGFMIEMGGGPPGGMIP